MNQKNTTILVVDDDFFNVQVLQAILENAKYSVVSVYGGYEAIEKISSTKIDVIMLDLLMPGIDGFQVLEFCKESNILQNTKVIVVSAVTETEDIQRAMSLGASDFITKPFINSELLRKLTSVIC